MASISAASSAVKNTHGPGRTGTGGVAEPGHHGMPRLMVRAEADVAVMRRVAVDVSNERRVI